MTPARYARIKEIFAAARERPEAQRAAGCSPSPKPHN
jgi:hypothetical protein